VVDDFDMGITHVIRGEDHISNTPRQILIQEACGAPRPVYAHIPLILAPDRSKLSKRKHGETVSLAHYRAQGISSPAMLNFLALVGWHPSASDASEVLSFDDLIKQFDLARVQKGGAVFDTHKLNWLNRQYAKRR
jgi:glutamyl/glutaminyl-tRNA synthetase